MEQIHTQNVAVGMELTAEKVYIDNSAKSDTIIEAITLQIDGSTSEDSLQFARDAKINNHSGKLRCHNANINRLDGGEVHATNVNIKSAISGTVYAQDVIIENIHSNLKIFASNSITITKIVGKGNLFKINYKSSSVTIILQNMSRKFVQNFLL